MHFTRRQFVIGSSVCLGTVISPWLLHVDDAKASREPPQEAVTASPFFVLGRIGYGATPQQLAELKTLGLKAYLEQQLNPVNVQDTLANARLSRSTMHIEYKDGDGYKGINEDRPLLALGTPIEELWKLVDNKVKIAGQERSRPTQEVRAATWIRAIYSKWQLREVMVEFWHNHFNVSAFSDTHIAVTFPLYDAMIRKNCLGNFRNFLEDVAQSTGMLYYLNNAKSRASPANENYARELFELHTLGADHYYNELYNRWREVPGAIKGRPIGYIDQDVYEAARSFTGWTVADGSNPGGTLLPNTGKFTYFDGWHDNYQKRVLGVEFDPNTPPLADGKKVLDLIAAHPGTAMNLSLKLCRRLVADEPPPSLVKKVARVWQQSLHKPDQIKQVLRALILSPEFAASEGQKTKRPPEYIYSFMRGASVDFTPNEGIFGTLSGSGYRQFEWPTPTGHPDVAQYWLNTNSVLASWNLLAFLVGGGFNKAAKFDLAAQTPPQVKTSRDIVIYWTQRLTGKPPQSSTLIAALMQYMPQSHNPEFMPDLRQPQLKEPLQQMALAIAMLPDFQVR